jgi:hypothetical protein
MMEPSSSASSVPVMYVPEEWQGMSFDERTELLERKRAELDEFENEVQLYRDAHEWDEGYMERATKDLFYYLRFIEKLEKTLTE